jgi:membrane protein YdbS with pleckstrin-like domain
MPAEPIPAHVAAIERPSPPLWNYYVLQAVASNVAFPITIVVLFFRYHTMRYRFDAEGIHMKWGILIRREVMLNYSRIQDIQLRANFIERWLGLARIEIQTASGSAGAQMTLEGLLNFVEVRDFLYSRMRGARHLGDQPVTVSSESLVDVLTGVAGELRAIRELVAARERDGTAR